MTFEKTLMKRVGVVPYVVRAPQSVKLSPLLPLIATISTPPFRKERVTNCVSCPAVHRRQAMSNVSQARDQTLEHAIQVVTPWGDVPIAGH